MPARRPSLGTVLGSLALVMSMTGTAVAVTQAQSGDTLITQRSLSGNRLRLNTVTGAEVNESTLGTVPKAQLANTLPKVTWHNLTLINDWQNMYTDRPVAWAIDAQGFVHFRGAMKCWDATTQDYCSGLAHMIFANAPAAIRNATDPIVGEVSWLHGDPGAVVVYSDGRMASMNRNFQENASFVETDLDGLVYYPG